MLAGGARGIAYKMNAPIFFGARALGGGAKGTVVGEQGGVGSCQQRWLP
jgi:hypothetical protein